MQKQEKVIVRGLRRRKFYQRIQSLGSAGGVNLSDLSYNMVAKVRKTVLYTQNFAKNLEINYSYNKEVKEGWKWGRERRKREGRKKRGSEGGEREREWYFDHFLVTLKSMVYIKYLQLYVNLTSINFFNGKTFQPVSVQHF